MEIVRYLTRKETASYLKIAESTVILWLKTGKLNPERHVLTNRPLFTREYLNKFIEEMKEKRDKEKENWFKELIKKEDDQMDAVSQAMIDTITSIKKSRDVLNEK